MRVNFNSCWISTHNTSILCRLCGFGRSTWNIYKYLSHKFNRWICSIRSPKSIQIFSYSLSPRFTYAIPHHEFWVEFVDCIFSASAQRPAICCCEQHIGMFVCHKQQECLDQTELLWCLKKNPTACSQIQTAVRLHSKVPAITGPVCHINLL